MLIPPRRNACRHRSFVFFTALTFVTIGPLQGADALPPYRDPALPPEARIDDLLPRMSMEEKLGQLSQGVIDKPAAVDASRDQVRAGAIGSFIHALPPGETVAARNTLQHIAVEESRLGIPLVFGFDSIHGYQTVFPIPLGLASTWDPGLIERLQAVSARETRAAGIDWTFAPICDIARDPRWGRVAETFGEDPFLAGMLAAAAVRGFQGDDPSAPDRVAATLKHFAGYGAVLGGRDYHESDIPEFAMRNRHLPVFRAGIEAGALAVMSAFTANDGIPSVANPRLLTDILRGEWGFTGPVVSDWGAVDETVTWGFAADRDEAARLCLTAGNDIEMVTTAYRDTLAMQVHSGLVPMEAVDLAVRRVLRLKFQLGLFDHPYANASAQDAASRQPDAITLARTAASRSTVLIKNDGALPLHDLPLRIALIGPLGDHPWEMLGCWQGHGESRHVVTLAAGLRSRLPAGATLNVVEGCALARQQDRTFADKVTVYDELPPDPAERARGFPEAVAAAEAADVVILAVGEYRALSGEVASRSRLGLTGNQQALCDAVSAVGKPVVAVVFSGRPLAIAELEARANAVLLAWHPGEQGGTALAGLLFGDQAPTGRLPVSLPRSVGQLPLFYNQLYTGRPDKLDYRDSTNIPLRPFGFGLAYTDFSYGPVTIQPGDPKFAETTITNTGPRPGEAVAQLYVRALATREGARPGRELRGWERITLAPGESRNVRFALTPDALGHTSRDGRRVLEPGRYQVWISADAASGAPVELEIKAPSREP